MLDKKRYFLLNFYHSMNDGFFDSIPVILSFIVLLYGYGEKEIGIIISLGAALGTIASLGTMYVAKILSPFKIIGLIIFIYSICFLLASFCSNFIIISLFFIISMIGYAIFHNICFSYLTLNTPRQKLGKILSDFTAIGDIGRIPFIAIAGYIAALTLFSISGWKIVCFIFGILGIISIIFIFFQQETKAAKNAKQKSSTLPSFSILKSKPVFLTVLSSALNAFSNEKIFTFLPLLLIFKGLDPKIIGTFAVGFTVGSFLGKLACGRLLDMFGPKSVFITAEILLSFFLIFIIITNDLYFIVAISFLIGVLTKGTVPVIQAIITIPFQKIGQYDEIFSINSFIRGIINMITPILFGYIASLWNINTVYIIMAIISLLSVVPLISFHDNDIIEEAA